jgi:Zn-dependent protease
MFMVAAAGPLTNVVLAVASSIGMRIAIAHVAGPWGSQIALPLYYMLRASVVINVVLAIFNLLPLLPLDGGRVVVSILPLNAARAFSRLEPFGFFILLVLLYTDSVERVINPIINAIARVLL